MQLKEEALVLLLGAIPGSCAAESENILVGFSSQGGSVKMRDWKVEWGVGWGWSLPQLRGIADFFLVNERDLEEASGGREGAMFYYRQEQKIKEYSSCNTCTFVKHLIP